MKRIGATLLITTMIFALVGCGSSSSGNSKGETCKLNVTTVFAGVDGNAQNYKDCCAAWEEMTGNTVMDSSSTTDETFKIRVVTDFETGSEPDVLFFFNGADANPFIEAGKVVPIDEIREEYPDYASNMDDDMITGSMVDGKKYAVPVCGYWEAMFVNMKVLDAAGVEKPGADYTMDQFKEDCRKIKEAGYTPIACSLSDAPHYWWEHEIFNQNSPETHLIIPKDLESGQGWVNAMNDIKELYEFGYFPENTCSSKDDQTFSMFVNDKAAFLVDGSWKVGSIVQACQTDEKDPSTLDEDRLSHFDVTYFPGNGDRKATDAIGGFSQGYYITRKAWDDPVKREAAVSFVSYMTSNETVSLFAQHTATPLKEAPPVDESKFNSLQIKALKMRDGLTSLTPAVQDIFSGACRKTTFETGLPKIVTGKVTAEEAVEEGLRIYNESLEE